MDGVRGVAAVSVMLLHITPSRAGVLFPMAHFAVDVFFCLSGFVLAEAYGSKLARGLSAEAFLRARLTRLYPMYALGLALGLSGAIVAMGLGAPPIGALRFAFVAFAAALMLPVAAQPVFGFNLASPEVPYPFNLVSWSLFEELAVNALFARSRPRGSPLAALIGIAILGFIATTVAAGRPCGFLTSTLAGGFPRAVFGFYVGAAIHGWYVTGTLPVGRLALLPPLAVAVIALTLPKSTPAYLIAAIFAAPAIVAASIGDPRSERLRAIFTRLGRLSFPLYALHYPAFELFKIGYNTLAGSPYAETPPAPALAGFAFAVTLFASWAAESVEPPARAWVARRFADFGVMRCGEGGASGVPGAESGAGA
ncbi:MAG: acyltransferase family protein [Roseiarcus sp.]